MAEDYRTVMDRAFVEHLARTTAHSSASAAAILLSVGVRDALHAAGRAAIDNLVREVGSR